MLIISICFINAWRKNKVFQNCSKFSDWKQQPTILFYYPGNISRQIVENRTEVQKRRAWQNLILTEQLRGSLSIAGSMYSVFAVADKLHRTIFDAQNTEFLLRKLVRNEDGKSKGRRYIF